MARKVAELTLPKQTIWVPVESFAPEPYEVLRRFTAVVTPLEEGFEAGFYDANIHASGDTEQEAVENLKSLLLDYFDRLNELDDSVLGPEPSRQKRILNIHIRTQKQCRELWDCTRSRETVIEILGTKGLL